MADLNETPRQKMIGILYLVLLGLAATTITDHVLDAFYNITLSLDNTSKALNEATEAKLSSFAAHNLKDDPARATPFWERANKVKKLCEDLDKEVLEIKQQMVTQGGGYKKALGREGEVEQRDNTDMAPRLMMMPTPENGKGAKLKKRVMETRQAILDLMTTEERTGVTVPLNAIDPPKREGIKATWENDCFGEGIPLTAALTSISKIEMDIKNTENSVVRKILSMVDKSDFNLDDYQVIAVPQSSYVLVGQQYKAEVFLTAFSATLQPEITAGGTNLKVENGKGIYTVPCTSEGIKKYSATIRMKKADGTYKEFKTTEDLQYQVAKPSVTISPTKMLVFYIGVDNPVSISAAGAPKESLRPSISGTGGGEMKGANGEYTVTVQHPGKVTIAVSGELEKGKTTVLGSTEFKCKPIPPPHPLFAGSSGGGVSTGSLKAQTKVFAKLDDFDFDAPFVVNGFKLVILKPRADAVILQSSSASLTSEMMSTMSTITAGTRIMIDNITATGPDKLKRPLPPISFTAQ